jgi:regulatory protein
MTKTITALSVQKRNQDRINVFLDGEYAFSISLNAALSLKRGQKLSQVDIERLQREDDGFRAYNSALRFLGYRPRSRLEIERHLRQKGYESEAIDAAMARLVAQRYIDDEAFARSWLNHRERLRPRGARGLSYELRQKGIEREIINEVLTELDEEASAWAAIEGKRHRWRGLDQLAFRKKVTGFLSRRGFSYDIIRKTCQKAWEAMDS